MGADNKRQKFKELVVQFNFEPTEEKRQALMDIAREIDPVGYGNLKKCQCAYEFHMILDAMVSP